MVCSGRPPPQTRHLWVHLEKMGFHGKLDLLTPYGKWGGFGKTEMSRNTLRNFIDPRSATICLTKKPNLFKFMICGKLTFQCTRNGPQNLPYCPGSIQDTFIIYSSISHRHVFKKLLREEQISTIQNLKIWKSKNPGSLTGAQVYDDRANASCMPLKIRKRS